MRHPQLTRNDFTVSWLRIILQSEAILKVIHDCKMDSDALFHLLKIELTNVHDTSCWHKAIGLDRKSLNDTLVHHGLGPNSIRDASVYQVNHAFWATRPLTAQMVEWASGDVRFMFDLHQRQCSTAAPASAHVAKAYAAEFLSECRSAKVGKVTLRNPRKFVGKGGANVQKLMAATGCFMYKSGPRINNEYVVYYQTRRWIRRIHKSGRSLILNKFPNCL